MIQYRLAYRIRNKTYFGNWNDNKSLIESWITWANENYSEIRHWLEVYEEK